MEVMQVQPFKPIATSPTKEKGDLAVSDLYSPFLEYAKQSWFGMADSVYDYVQGYYNVAAGLPENLHTVTIHAYQGATLQKLAGVLASLLVKAVNSFMSVNI